MRVAVHLGAVALALAATCGSAQTRDQIRVVGSSTVYPYSQAVAEQYADRTGARAPVIESTGTGAGMQLFCSGVGVGFPDIVAASRAMKPSEHAVCLANGVDDITEARIGNDGLTLAQSIDGSDLDLSKAQLFESLAAAVEVEGKIVANPFERWNQIAPSLPDRPIVVFGPPPTSGTRDAFLELVMESGCADFPAIASLDAQDRAEECERMRQDDRFIEAGENDNSTIQRLEADPSALGIFGYSSLYENRDRLKAVAVDGVLPSPATIADGSYPLARPLYLYVKNAHRRIVPGLQSFIAEYVSENSLGPSGYLTELGLIALPDAARHDMQASVLAAEPTGRFN